MPRTKGFQVRIWEQSAGEEPPEHAAYLEEDGNRKIFVTQRAARDAAVEYVRDAPELTYAIEPQVR